MAEVHGHCDARFFKLHELMQEFVSSGQDVGASLCVNLGGENVVDIWGGFADLSTKQPWEKDTVVNVFSSTKLVTNLAALVLISRGMVAASDKVAKHWPEFAENGKSDVTVAHVLTHAAGVSGWDDKMTLEDMCDVRAATEKLARQAPWWTPGTATGYHAITQGFILGEIVRRKTGMALDKFVADEMLGPIGHVDFQYGCRKENRSRVSPVIPPSGPPVQHLMSQLPGDITSRTLMNPFFGAEAANTELWQSSLLPSLNGHTNARALVRILSCIALKGVCAGGHRLLSAETVTQALAEHSSGVDLVVGGYARRGLGVYLTGGDASTLNKLPEGNVCWGGGWGGSFVIMDADRGLTVAYAMNRMVDGYHPSARAYLKALYGVFGVVLAD